MRIRKNPRSSMKRRHRRRATSIARKGAWSRGFTARRSLVSGGPACPDISEKLQALKNLIPFQKRETVKADQLFQETADYIILLRAQVVILQRLIDHYGPAEINQNVES